MIVSETEYRIAFFIRIGLSYKNIAPKVGLASGASARARASELAERLPGHGTPKFKILKLSSMNELQPRNVTAVPTHS